MRTLHVDTGREMRGGQWQALRLVERLPAEGISATLLCRAGSPLYTEAVRRGVDTRPLGICTLARLARASDLVHAHDARAHTLAALAAPGRPLVVARRVAFPIASAWKYRRAAHYLAVSRFVAGVLETGGVAGGANLGGLRRRTCTEPAAGPRHGILAVEIADPLKGGRPCAARRRARRRGRAVFTMPGSRSPRRRYVRLHHRV